MRRNADNFGVAKYRMAKHGKDKLQLKHILPKCDIFYFGTNMLYDIIYTTPKHQDITCYT